MPFFIQQGYEWNKYNQTHYDTDNPPPKIVQGYKFNVSIPSFSSCLFHIYVQKLEVHISQLETDILLTCIVK